MRALALQILMNDIKSQQIQFLSMMASLQFMVFGLLGEVVTRIYYGSQQKQHYAIRELVNFDDQQEPVRLAA